MARTHSGPRDCGGCGRPMTAKALAVVDGLPYCAACYQRRFRPIRCDGCGKRMRSLDGGIPARCKSCKTKERRCLRCGKPVPRAGLVVPDGVACPSCARYFKAPKPCPACGRMSQRLERDVKAGFSEPACGKCRRQGHRVCAGCRKYRRPAGVNGQGKPVCQNCLDRGDAPFICPRCGKPGRPHSTRRCEDCYWQDAVEKKLQDHLTSLSRPWVRDVFSGFADELKARIGAHKAAAKLPRYFSYFRTLDSLFEAPNELTAERLVTAFGLDGLRRFAVPHGYLLKAGLAPEHAEEAMTAAAERARWEAILTRADSRWYGALLRRFFGFLEAIRMRYHDRGWRGERSRFKPHTITLALRSAVKFLEHLSPDGVISPQQVDQTYVDRFLVQHGGHRNSLRAFVRYLNRKERLFRLIRIERVARSVPPGLILDRTTYASLLAVWLRASGRADKEALICLLMVLYAQTITRIVRLKLSDIARGENGVYRVTFGRTEIALDPRVGVLMEQYLAARRALTVMEDEWENEWLFPGRSRGAHLSEATVNDYLRKYGVTADMLFSTALYYAYLSGLRHPKVLVKAFGITDQTAIKYMNLVDPRLRDEVKARLADA